MYDQEALSYSKDSYSASENKRSGVGQEMVQFCRDIWKQCSYILAPPTDLVGLGKKKLKQNLNYKNPLKE